MPDSIDLGQLLGLHAARSIRGPCRARSTSASPATRGRRAACIACCRRSRATATTPAACMAARTLTFADYALCLVAGRAADGGTNTAFAVTVSIAVEFLDAGRVGLPLEASGEPLQVTGRLAFARGSDHPAGQTIALWSGVCRHIARQGDGAQGRAAAAAARPSRRRACRPASSRCQRQRLLPPYRPLLCPQGDRRRLPGPAHPAAHVQLGRRAARRLHDELRRLGGDARRRRITGMAPSTVAFAAEFLSAGTPPCRSPPGSRCRATASRSPSCAACSSRTAASSCPIRRP